MIPPAGPASPSAPSDHRLPLTVVTGFLGSGKTTLIANLLRHRDLARTAVIINELGEIGLDHELIESSDEDLVELSTGCICCSMRGDLSTTVARLLDRRGGDFDRIVLETTGIADPAPIVHATMADPLLARQVRLAEMIVTVDALTAGQTLDAHLVSRRQIGLADRLLLTKTDLAPDVDGALEARLRAINPHATLSTVTLGRIEPDALLDPSQPETRRPPPHREHPLDPPPTGVPGHDRHAHDDIGSVSLRLAGPLHAVTLTLVLQTLAEVCGPDLLRIKGLVEVVENPGRPALVHGVQHVFHPLEWLDAWPGASEDSRLVLIGRRLEAGWITALIELLEHEVQGAAASA